MKEKSENQTDILIESFELIIKLATQELCCYTGGEAARIETIRKIRKVAQSTVIRFERDKGLTPDLYKIYESAGHKIMVDSEGDGKCEFCNEYMTFPVKKCEAL